MGAQLPPPLKKEERPPIFGSCIVTKRSPISATAELLLRILSLEIAAGDVQCTNFNEFSEIKKIRKNSYKNSLNARV